MKSEIRSTDSKARISLPKAFANSRVLIDQISDTEVRIRKTKVISKGEMTFEEKFREPLSDADRDMFLALLSNPPKPNAAIKRAVAKYRSRNA